MNRRKPYYKWKVKCKLLTYPERCWHFIYNIDAI